MPNVIHHIELWTIDLARTAPSFDWLLGALDWQAEVDPSWPQGRTWRHPSGAYIVLEQSPAVTGPQQRTHAGMNHLALRATDRMQLEALRAECSANGWHELFADRYPHAGGPEHTALFIENDEGFELELVAE